MTQPNPTSPLAPLDDRRGFGARALLAGAAQPLLRRAARAYVAGDTLADALAAQAVLANDGRYATLGYWNGDGEDPRGVLARYQATIAALSANCWAGTCSVKLPALKFQPDLSQALAVAGKASRVALHCDSLGYDDADAIFQTVDGWRQAGVMVGVTLPGRWRRSVADARWAAARDLPVRVVKGQWADPTDPSRDLRGGFLETIDVLAAAGARRVAVATHDLPLATTAIEQLRGAGVSVTLELLYGLPLRSAQSLARRLQVDVRVYVPFGASYLPYALSKLVRRPDIAWRFLHDLVAGVVSPERRIG